MNFYQKIEYGYLLLLPRGDILKSRLKFLARNTDKCFMVRGGS